MPSTASPPADWNWSPRPAAATSSVARPPAKDCVATLPFIDQTGVAVAAEEFT
jgi:hypothetical protein